ncbi:MAG: hypothetical protein AAFX45_14225, partial [Pseudomonadota bacterium]
AHFRPPVSCRRGHVWTAAESGLTGPKDLADLAGHGARTFLIGEHLMRQADVAAATRAILANPLAPSVIGAA